MGAICNVTPPLYREHFTWESFSLLEVLKEVRCENLIYADLGWPPPPHYKGIFRSMQIWLDVFDPPHQNFTGAICYITPVLNDILDLCRFDLTYLTPRRQNFTGAICYVTPVLNDILDLCRFDLTYLTPPPKFHRFNLLRYTCVKWYFRSMQIWLDVFDPPANISQMQFVTLHLC